MSTSAYRDLDKLTAAMRIRAENWLREAVSAGFPVLITETWRSLERQEYLYASGRTRPGNIVTWTMQSKHLLGEAIDIAFFANGKISYEGDWEGIGRVGERVGLLWGGRWPTPDRPHFEFNYAWQEQHWAAPCEQKLIAAGIIKQKKNLNEPPTRGELYTILTRLHNF